MIKSKSSLLFEQLLYCFCGAVGNGSSGQSEPAQQVVGQPYAGSESVQQLVQLAGGKNSQDLSKLATDISQAIPGLSQALTTATNQSQAGMAGAGANLYSQYAPQLNQVGQQMGASNLQANANAIGSTLNSPATAQIGQGFSQGQSSLNPSYNTTMQGLNSMMSSASPTGFTGSQMDQIGRGLAQQNYQGGNFNTMGNNPLGSLNNAMTFGTGLQNMQTQYGNLASSAANTANTLNGGQNIFGMSTAQPTGTASPTTNTTTSQFLQSPSTAATAATTAAGTAQNVLSGLGSLYSQGNTAAAGQNMSSNSSCGGGASTGGYS